MKKEKPFDDMKTVIAIPAYKAFLTPEETGALRQCVQIFGGRRDIVLFVPESLDCSAYLEIIPDAVVQRFDNSFFTSIFSYSTLLLTPAFYHRFEQYEYMLIYQLDGWVFRDDLDDWCSRGYEYIGAPFFLQDGKRNIPVAGNGGVSLRKISAMLRVLSSPEKRMFPRKLLLRFCRNYVAAGNYVRCLIPLLKAAGVLPNSRGRYLESVRSSCLNQEDVVFYFLSREFTPDGLIMPSLEEAALFSLDSSPRQFYRELPSFCHAWQKNDRSFWERYIKI